MFEHIALALEVRDLTVCYGQAEALSRVSLALPVGQIVTVIGPNGAGKSTLLNGLMGLVRSRSGSVTLFGKPVRRLPEERLANGLALVPERRELFTTMSVKDNLLLGAYPRYCSGETGWKDALDEVYALFPRLAERSSQEAGSLSGGERQMVALGRALMSRPKVLMLDEPSLGLAPLVVREIFQAIRGLRACGISTLLVEQNARAALQTADYGYVLENGVVTAEGRAAELAGDQRIAASYLGAAAMQRTGAPA